MEYYLRQYQELKNHQPLKSLKNSDIFINKIINNINDENCNTFKNIKIYGTNECPLFIPSEIRDTLKIDPTTFKRKLNELEENEHFIICDYIGYSVSGSEENTRNQTQKRLLTKFGLHELIYISNTAVAKLFKRFINVLLSDLENEGKIVLEKALNHHKKVIQYLTEEKEKLESAKNKLIDDKKYLQESNFCLTHIYNHAETIKYLTIDDEDSTTQDYEKKYSFALEKLMEKHNVSLYLVDYKEEMKEILQNKLLPKIKKIINAKPVKKSSESQSDDNDNDYNEEKPKKKSEKFDDNEIKNIIKHFKFMSYEKENILDISEDEMLGYLLDYYNLDTNEDFDYYPGNTSILTDKNRNCMFSIKPTKTKTDKNTYYPVGHIFIANKEHMAALMEKLNEQKCPLFGENALYVSYTMLINNAKRLLVDKIYKEKLQEKNNKLIMDVRVALEKF